MNIILHCYITYVQAGKLGRRTVKGIMVEDQLHQNPEVFPPGGILTLTELLAGEFLTWS